MKQLFEIYIYSPSKEETEYFFNTIFKSSLSLYSSNLFKNRASNYIFQVAGQHVDTISRRDRKWPGKVENDSAVEGPRATVSRYRYPPLLLRPRSPPSTRLPQWRSVRDWSTHSGTKSPYWSDNTFHGVEERSVVGSPHLTVPVLFPVTSLGSTKLWVAQGEEIARSSELFFLYPPLRSFTNEFIVFFDRTKNVSPLDFWAKWN